MNLSEAHIEFNIADWENWVWSDGMLEHWESWAMYCMGGEL